LKWVWPADGAVISQYNPAQDIKGIRIGGKQGDPVRAAADGEVVYASDRLTEYGNLVLIRHASGGYVTAYAHNSKNLVTENQHVKAGQKIAEMGSTGAPQTMLEFQIRLNGKPLNPISLLPQR
jgi:lipoprotein NlpD